MADLGRARRRLGLAVAVLVLAAACTGGGATPADDSAAPAASATPDGPVRVEVGDDLADVVTAQPPGTAFVLAAGVHRGQRVEPRDGDTFEGEDGAVLTGAEPVTGFEEVEPGRWRLEGVAAEGLVHGQTLPGEEGAMQSQQLFVDGERIRPVASIAEVGPGTWHLDYGTDQAWVGTEPGVVLGETELSTADSAFYGIAEDVVIRNLTVERYANRAQVGAIAAHASSGWTLEDVVVRENHGAGVTVAPGMTITGSQIIGNGQIGLVGDCFDEGDAITISDSTISGNGAFGFDWRWEAGGIKLKDCRVGTTISDNVVSDNVGPGIWIDVDSSDMTVVDNVVEDNTGAGLFYEISFGGSVLRGNQVRGNGSDDFGIAVRLSSSTGVTFEDNVIDALDVGFSIQDYPRGEAGQGQRQIEDATLSRNTITAPRPLVIDRIDLTRIGTALVFDANSYEVVGDGPVAIVDGTEYDEAGWREAAGEETP